MSLTLVGNRVLVLPDPPDRTLPAGLVMPDNAVPEVPVSGIVESVGLGFASPSFPDPTELVGHRVFFSPVAGQDIAHDGREWIALREEELLAIETEDPDAE